MSLSYSLNRHIFQGLDSLNSLVLWYTHKQKFNIPISRKQVPFILTKECENQSKKSQRNPIFDYQNNQVQILQYCLYIYFNMATIFIGTAYNQLVKVHTEDKRKTKTVYGAMARQPILHISHYPETDHTIYASSKSISSVQNGQSNEIVKIYGPEKVINVELNKITGKLEYVLSNGSLHSAYYIQQSQQCEFEEVYKGESHNLYTGAAHSYYQEKCLFFGKGIVPMVISKEHSVVTWKGKNVKKDQLDLEVPINDVAGRFINHDKFLAILNSNNKLRIYDIRGTHKRPVNDVQLKTTPKYAMTQMVVNHDESKFYVANDGGQIFELDSRKNYEPTGKYKGISTSITGLSVGEKWVVASSLDCYVRIFDLNDRTELKKYYFNKPINSLQASYQEQEVQEKLQQLSHYEEEIELSEQEQQNEKKKEKVKQIRKRNKVGLKYVRPQQFDTPEEVPIKEEQGHGRRKWLNQLNPIDRLQFQQQE